MKKLINAENVFGFLVIILFIILIVSVVLSAKQSHQTTPKPIEKPKTTQTIIKKVLNPDDYIETSMGKDWIFVGEANNQVTIRIDNHGLFRQKDEYLTLPVMNKDTILPYTSNGYIKFIKDKSSIKMIYHYNDILLID